MAGLDTEVPVRRDVLDELQVPRRSSRAARISGVTGDSAISEASTAISSSTRAPCVSISTRS